MARSAEEVEELRSEVRLLEAEGTKVQLQQMHAKLKMDDEKEELVKKLHENEQQLEETRRQLAAAEANCAAAGELEQQLAAARPQLAQGPQHTGAMPGAAATPTLQAGVAPGGQAADSFGEPQQLENQESSAAAGHDQATATASLFGQEVASTTSLFGQEPSSAAGYFDDPQQQ